MSADGAHQGITPRRALGTVLGGEPPPAEDEGMDAEAFEAWIMAAPDPLALASEEYIGREGDGYDDYARATAKVILVHLKAHPEDARLPLESAYQWTEDGRDFVRGEDGRPIKTNVTLYDRLCQLYPDAHEHVFTLLSGFQWGYAVNAARRCLEVPPAPNPALITVETQS